MDIHHPAATVSGIDEGIVSKRADAPYHSGPSKDWIKVKCIGGRNANRERWRLFDRR